MITGDMGQYFGSSSVGGGYLVEGLLSGLVSYLNLISVGLSYIRAVDML